MVRVIICLFFLSFKVGNPYLDKHKNQKGRFEYMWNHGVLSDEAMANITNHCSFNSSENKLCSQFYGWYDFGPIDTFDIYAPICIDEPDGSYHSSGYVRDRLTISRSHCLYSTCTGNFLNPSQISVTMHAVSRVQCM